jgi:hypothetical protein
MDHAELGRTQQIRCADCNEFTPSYDIINYGSIGKGYRQICSRCFNDEVAKSDGLTNFEHLKFDPIDLVDCAGKAHVFHFRIRLFGPGVALDAFELRDEHAAGYQFQVIGEPGDDLLALLGQLIDKIRRVLSHRHIVDGELGPQIADHGLVLGAIEWDETRGGQVPLVIIDGREITWDELGRMLMTYEGWQFKLEIRDKSEEF